MVLGKTFLRQTDGADDFRAQVRFAAYPIVQLFAHRVVEKAVDGEVAPAGIGRRVAKANLFRMPAILVIRLGPERSDLELVAAFDHHHHAELAADRNGALEGSLDLVRQRGGDDVVIARLALQQEIAHATADPEGGEAGGLEAGHDILGCFAQGSHHAESRFESKRIRPNPKSEIRNPKQIRNSKKQCSKPGWPARFETLNFGFWVCFGFRISGFGFRGPGRLKPQAIVWLCLMSHPIAAQRARRPCAPHQASDPGRTQTP